MRHTDSNQYSHSGNNTQRQQSRTQTSINTHTAVRPDLLILLCIPAPAQHIVSSDGRKLHLVHNCPHVASHHAEVVMSVAHRARHRELSPRRPRPLWLRFALVGVRPPVGRVRGLRVVGPVDPANLPESLHAGIGSPRGKKGLEEPCETCRAGITYWLAGRIVQAMNRVLIAHERQSSLLEALFGRIGSAEAVDVSAVVVGADHPADLDLPACGPLGHHIKPRQLRASVEL